MIGFLAAACSPSPALRFRRERSSLPRRLRYATGGFRVRRAVNNNGPAHDLCSLALSSNTNGARRPQSSVPVALFRTRRSSKASAIGRNRAPITLRRLHTAMANTLLDSATGVATRPSVYRRCEQPYRKLHLSHRPRCARCTHRRAPQPWLHGRHSDHRGQQYRLAKPRRLLGDSRQSVRREPLEATSHLNSLASGRAVAWHAVQWRHRRWATAGPSFLGAFQGRDQADGQRERSDSGAQPVTFRYKKELDPKASHSSAWWPSRWQR